MTGPVTSTSNSQHSSSSSSLVIYPPAPVETYNGNWKNLLNFLREWKPCSRLPDNFNRLAWQRAWVIKLLFLRSAAASETLYQEVDIRGKTSHYQEHAELLACFEMLTKAFELSRDLHGIRFNVTQSPVGNLIIEIKQDHHSA